MSAINNYQIIDKIVEAIKSRNIVSFYYKEPNELIQTLRIGYPHAIYPHVTTRSILVDFYQIDGQSSDVRNLPNWRRFNIEYISNINIFKDRTFLVQDGYNPNSKSYSNAIAKI